MRQLICCIALLVLAGCSQDRDFSRLTFDESARSDRGSRVKSDSDQVYLPYRQNLMGLLREHGIKPTEVGMRVDQNDEKVVILSISESHGEEERLESFQKALESVVQAREVFPLTIEFSLDLESSDNADQPEDRLEPLPSYKAAITLDGVELSHSYGLGDTFADALSQRQPTLEAHCAIAAKVSPPLPIDYLKYEESDGDEGGRYKVSVDDITGTYTAAITFNSKELQTMLEQREANPAMPTDSRAKTEMLFRGNMGQVDLRLGPIGQVAHEHGSVDVVTHSGLRTRCTELAISKGRPFTFFMGDSLDRLVAVSAIEPQP